MSAYSSSVASSSLFRAIGRRMVEEEEIEPWDVLKLNESVPRIEGVITFISSFCIMWMAWNRRDRLFHRLVLGMSFHLLVFGVFLIYGIAAIPNSEENYPLDSSGTITTCTIQGFFLYVTSFTSIFYYGSFSIYSYVGVLNNFEKSKIIWVEKYIHILVHIYPLCSAFYFLSQEGFNDSGHGICYMNSNPTNCWHDPSIPCERGPESRLMLLFLIIPLSLALLLPSIVMIVLILRVRKSQKEIFIDAMSIAKQGVVYLVALYWTLVPYSIAIFLGKLNFQGIIDHHYILSFWIFVYLNFGVFALWSMLSYLYFSVEKKIISTTVTRNDNDSKSNTTAILLKNGTNTTDTAELKTSHDFIFTSSQEIIETQDTPIQVTEAKATESSAQQHKYSFNIFDGTDASGAFASFIHDGDSEDEMVDNAATEHWAAVQDHI